MSNEYTEQYRAFIAKLQSEEERPAALNDLKNLFIIKPPGEAANSIKEVGISQIIYCLNTRDKNQKSLACEVLKVCFEQLKVGDLAKHYTGHLMYLLRHEDSCVRKLAIDEVSKILSADPNILPADEHMAIFVAIAQMVTDKDFNVASSAIQITSNLTFQAYPKILEEMKIALEDNSSSKCNAFEVVVNISSKSSELFNLCVDLKYLEAMVCELQTDDILYQLNILELLSRVAVTIHGINYLVKEGAIDTISRLFEDAAGGPLRGLLAPGYIKFFGCIAHHYPKEIFNKYPVLLNMLFNSFEDDDSTLLPVSLDTLGFVGETIEGKLCLAATGGDFTQAVQTVGNIIRNSSSEKKIRALHCLASLISVDKDPSKPKSGPADHRVTLMTREWFRSLSISSGGMDVLFTMCKNPFPDIRLAAFTLLDAVCQHQWGEELVARTAGFIEYLLDRSVDHTKESKEAKYDIVKRLANSMAFDATIIMRLQTYVEQGPFYTETQMEVAMEEAD